MTGRYAAGYALTVALGVACSPSAGKGADAGAFDADSGPPAEASDDGGPLCGSTTCASDQVCCVDPMSGMGTCSLRSACTGVPVTCLNRSYCAADQFCCAIFTGPGVDDGAAVGLDVVCASECTGRGKFQFCGSDSECPAGNTCSAGPFVRVCAKPLDAGS